jgi:hypothetical protein
VIFFVPLIEVLLYCCVKCTRGENSSQQAVQDLHHQLSVELKAEDWEGEEGSSHIIRMIDEYLSNDNDVAEILAVKSFPNICPSKRD